MPASRHEVFAHAERLEDVDPANVVELASR
jgi:hypothetical protein